MGEFVSAGPRVIQLDLSAGRVSERLDVPDGDFFSVWDATPRSLDPLIYVGFDKSDRQAQIPFRWKESRLGKFREVYVTNLAQPNTRVTLVFGYHREFLLRPMAGLSPAASSFQRSAALTAPAAGANYTGASDTTTLGGRRYRIIGFNFTLTTSATVASRIPRLFFQQNGSAEISYVAVSPVPINASLTARFHAWTGLQSQYLGAHTEEYVNLQLPDELILGGPLTVGITVENIQAADTLTEIEMFYEEL